MKYLGILIVATALLSGCATTNNLARMEAVEKNDAILVISQFEDTLSVKTVGTTIFTNNMISIDVTDWDINKYAEDQVKNLLSKNYTVLSNPELRRSISKPDYNYFTLEKHPLKGQDLFQYTESKGIKYVMVLSPMKYQDPYYNTNQFFEGFGIYQRGMMGSKNVKAYLQMFFWVYDGKTGEFVASGGVGGYKDPAPSWITSSPIRTNWIESKEQVDDEYLKSAEQKVQDMFKTLAQRSVRALKLKM